MSVEASELVSEVWTRWQGHVVNGVFPLGRYLGGSDHSGVFLTRSAARPSEVAIKLVPTNRALAESQLPRWKRAGGLAHPHVLRLLEWGGCQLDGLPYLYTVMEYADQTLAQLLLHRALTDDEAREMLLPIVDALAYLHGRNMVQGQLKPTNILVVGDQLKLASDTIRRVSEGPMNAATVYDPPEARQGISSAPGDIWALGVSLFEALTRRQPSGLGELREAVPPGDFSTAFRDIVASCLNPAPQERPDAAELARWVRGPASDPSPTTELPATVPAELTTPEPTAPEPTTPEPTTPEPGAFEASTPEPRALEPSTAEPCASDSSPTIELPALVLAEPTTPEPGASEPGAFEVRTPVPRALEPTIAVRPLQTATAPAPTKAERSAASTARPPKPGHLFAVILGALVMLALAWTAVRLLKAHRNPPAPLSAVEASGASAPDGPGAAAPAPGAVRTLVSSLSSPRKDVANSPSSLHEVMPDIPKNARRTIRGHVKVWVRVIVDQDGSVFAATPDRTGPSRYFERVAIDAAKKWTFPPVDSPPRRIMQVRFDFSRDGITGRAVALH